MSSADKNSETLTQRTPAKTDSTQISESNTSSKLSNLPIKTNFILNGYEHDQNTFLGRLRHQLETTNPKLMVTPEAEIRASIKLLKDFKYDPENVLRRKDITDRDLWRAQTIKRSSTNADTDEIIYQPFRLCGFVTWNMPVLIGLLWPNPSTATVFFWQWMNQNHNAAVNFANRNASNPTDPKLLAGSYVAACAGALSVPYYLNKTIRSSVKLTEAKKLALLRYTPFPSVVVANSINMFFMRSKELTDGIPVTDSETGEMVGSSKKAAFNAIAMTAVSRAIITAGVLFVPPLRFFAQDFFLC